MRLTLRLSFPGRVSAVANKVVQAELVTYLFTNYSTNLIPKCATGDKVTLTLDLALRQLMDMVSIQKASIRDFTTYEVIYSELQSLF